MLCNKNYLLQEWAVNLARGPLWVCRI